MNVESQSTNPYQPPSVQDREIESPRTGAARVITICIPPVLAIGCTLIFWLSFASVLGPVVNGSTVMFIWSGTLLVSVAVSTYLMILLWPRQLSAVSMAAGFVLFGIVFCLAEGDTSNGTDMLQMLILYSTLIAVPLMVFAMTRSLHRRRYTDATKLTSE